MSAGLRPEEVRGLPRPRHDEIFVDEFGVRPDSSRDQSERFNNALAFAATAGKVLVVPPGEYRCNSIQIGAGVTLRGFGAETVLRRATSATGPVASLVGANACLRDITIDGESSLGGGSGTGAVAVGSSADGALVYRVTVIDPVAHGIRINGAPDNIVVDDCKVTSTTDLAAIVYQGAGSGVGYTVRNCEVDKSGAADGSCIATGLNQTGAQTLTRVRIHGNRCLGGTSGACIELVTGSDDAIFDVKIYGNETDNGSMGVSIPRVQRFAIFGNTINLPAFIGIEVVGASFGTVGDNEITADPVDDASGIALNSATYVTVEGNTIVGCTGTAGITTNDEVGAIVPRNCALTGNVIEDCDIGIWIREGSSGFAVVGNIIDHVDTEGIRYGTTAGTSVNCCSNTVRNAPIGIRFDNAITYAGSVVGNVLNDTVTTPISINGSATVTLLRRLANAGAADAGASV